MKRREFLIGAAAGASVLAGNAFAQAVPGPAPGPFGASGFGRGGPALPLDRGTPATVGADKLARISIMTFNFTSRLKLANATPSADRVLEVFEIPQYFADVYGVHNVELQHSHFASTDTPYLQDFRARIEKVKSRMTQINVEFGVMNVSAPDNVQRAQCVDLTMRWVDHAVVLGCPRIMINQGTLTTASKANAIVALKAMGEYAKSKGVKISVETRVVPPTFDRGPGGAAVPVPGVLSPTGMPLAAPGDVPAWELAKEVVEGSGVYSNVDIGNITAPDQDQLHMVIKAMFPTNSGNMHMKTSPKWDFATAVKYTNNDLGYKGLYSIEVPPAQIRGVYDTILANI